MTYETVNVNSAKQTADLLMDALIVANANKQDATAGLLAILGMQYKGAQLSAKELQSFIKDASEYFLAYFFDRGTPTTSH